MTKKAAERKPCEFCGKVTPKIRRFCSQDCASKGLSAFYAKQRENQTYKISEEKHPGAIKITIYIEEIS